MHKNEELSSILDETPEGRKPIAFTLVNSSENGQELTINHAIPFSLPLHWETDNLGFLSKKHF